MHHPLQLAARLAVGTFFREVEVVGADRVPRKGPVIFVANHVNSLIDPVLLLARLPRRPGFLAKSTLWANTFLKPFLILGGAIPVYRRQDEGEDTSRNLETFARCHRLLAAGGTVALFPEGISHDHPRIQSLRTGAARIALETEQRHGPLGLRIVPVGLVFDDKQTFRSRAVVLVGEALDALDGADPADDVGPETVRRLTARISEALAEVTPQYASWQQARLIERAAGLFARDRSEDTRRSRLSETVPLIRAFRDGLDWMVAQEPGRVEELSAAVRRYDRLLDATGLRDEQVAASYPRGVVMGYLARALTALLLWLPLAIAGTVLNWLPYRMVGEVARRAAPTPDTRATYKLFSAVFLFPTVWALETTATWWLAGFPAWLGMLIGAPVSGYAALRFAERRRELAAEARAYLLLRSHHRAVIELVARRRELVDQVRELAERYLAARRTAEPDPDRTVPGQPGSAPPISEGSDHG